MMLGGYSVSTAVKSVGGLQGLFAIEPTEAMGYATAISICVGSFISGGTLTANFTRFARTPKIAVSATLIAFFLGNTLMFTFGAVGSMVTGQSDIAEVMFLQGADYASGTDAWSEHLDH